MSNGYIIPASIHIKIDQSNISTDTIEVIEQQGIVKGLPVNQDTVELIVGYQYLPLDINRINYLNRQPQIYNPQNYSSKNTGKNRSSGKPADNYDNVSYDFLKSGTIFRGINLKTNSGMSINSGLDLELEGKFTDEISITGALTDKNVPIQPEGNTQQLNEIDKVFITLDMPNENFTFGDYYLNVNEGRYGNYTRKLQGVKLSSKRGNFNNQAAGAVSKGKFHTNKFTGEEGKQGPYQLAGKNGEEAIIVLAGTEEVYLDGQRVVRGENNDYTIDYSTGEITFTPDQLITSNSRITVDFQYSDLVYQKNIVMTNSKVSLLDNALDISAQFINESDDKNNPIEIEINDEDREILKKAGDNSNSAFKSTIKKDSSGSYTFQDSILTYVGKEDGTHSAIFFNVGSKGEYRKHFTSNRVYFVYVDKNDPAVSPDKKAEAVYLPAKPLKLPAKQQQFQIRSNWQPAKNFRINSEVAGSYFDKNTFSPRDDGNNKGLAINMGGEYKSPETDYGRINIEGSFRNENKGFQAVGRNKSIEYERKWDTGLQDAGGERVYESNLKYNYKDNMLIKLGGGRLANDINTTLRNNQEVRFQYRWLNNFHYTREDINTDLASEMTKNWTRQRLRSEFGILNVQPYYEYYNEYRTNDSLTADNFKFHENTIGIGSRNSNPLKEDKFDWNISYHYRDNYKRPDGNWEKESRGQDLSIGGKLNNWKSFTAALKWTNREKEYYTGEQANSEYYLMKGQLIQRPQKLPYQWQTNFRIDEKYTVKKEKIYFKVDEGQGNYRYDSTYAEYVPHRLGNYILRIRPTNIRRPITNFKTGFQLRYNGRKLRKYIQNSFITRFSTFTNLRVDQEIENNHQLSNLYHFSLAGIDSNWVNYYRFFQQDIDYDFKSIRGYLKLRYKSNDNISERDVRGREKRQKDNYSLKYRGPFLLDINLISEISYYTNIRKSDINRMRNHDITGFEMENDFSYRLNTSNKFSFKLDFQHDREIETSNVESFLTRLKLEYERNFSRKGRTKSFFEFSRVNVTPENSTIPWEMSDGQKAGFTFGFGISLEYKIAKYLNLKANYEGWNEPQYGFYQLGNVELRAFF